LASAVHCWYAASIAADFDDERVHANACATYDGYGYNDADDDDDDLFSADIFAANWRDSATDEERRALEAEGAVTFHALWQYALTKARRRAHALDTVRGWSRQRLVEMLLSRYAPGIVGCPLLADERHPQRVPALRAAVLNATLGTLRRLASALLIVQRYEYDSVAIAATLGVRRPTARFESALDAFMVEYVPVDCMWSALFGRVTLADARRRTPTALWRHVYARPDEAAESRVSMDGDV